MSIDYDLKMKKWSIDGGKPKTHRAAMSALKREGLNQGEAETLLRANKLSAEIEHRRPPADDLLSYEEARVLRFALVANGLDRERSLLRAERWVRANLRPGRNRRSVRSLKHYCDGDYQRIGQACYLREADFADVLARCGHTVRDGYVGVKEIRA
jgi:hypothetical protein